MNHIADYSEKVMGNPADNQQEMRYSMSLSPGEVRNFQFQGHPNVQISVELLGPESPDIGDRKQKKSRIICSWYIPYSRLHGSDHRDDHISMSRGKSLKLIMGSFDLPKENGGHDAVFICPEKNVFGIADGVGGWAEKGIDAGQYAQQLMSNCSMLVRNGPKGSIKPLSVLENAYSSNKALGSSTACIVALTDENWLHFVNIGDSGFVVIRGDRIIDASPVQQHSFNCPFQLGNHVGSDKPSPAYESKVKVDVGDVIVAGTDGLFDNLFEEDIIKRVTLMTTFMGKSPCDLAQLLAEDAKVCSEDNNYRSPFSLRAELSGYKHLGGKPDDITVLVAYVVSSSGL